MDYVAKIKNAFSRNFTDRLSFPAILSLSILLVISQASFANDFFPDTVLDENDASPGDGICASTNNRCSLRAAIEEANALTGSHTIQLLATTYILSIQGRDEDASATGDLDITADITIIGMGAANTIINGGQIDRVFDVAANFKQGRYNTRGSSSVFNDLSITNGHVMILDSNNAYVDGGLGGGIYNTGDLILNDVWVYNNTAMGAGGGIFSITSYLELNHTLIYYNNSSSGAGLTFYNGRNELNNSFVIQNPPTNNPVSFLGGGIFNFSNLTINNSLLYENTAQADGGAIYHGLGQLDITNTTISNNLARRNGGGIFYRNGPIGNSPPNIPSLTHVTITNNIAEKFDTSGRGDPIMSFAPNDAGFTYPDGTPINFDIPAGASEGPLGGGGLAVSGQSDPANLRYTQITAVNSIISNNYTSSTKTSLDDCAYSATGSIKSLGGNLDTTSTCSFNQTTDLPGTDPQLIPFAIDSSFNTNNPTPSLTQAEFDLLQAQTQTIEITSPAIDKALDAYCEPIDQPGRNRPATGCDIGAFELLPPTANPMQYILRPSGVIESAFNVSYVNALSFTYNIVDIPVQGTVGLNAQPNLIDGAWIYTADANASGSDSFSYRTCLVSDTSVCSAPATITVLFINSTPVTNNVSIDIKTGSGSPSPITVINESQIVADVADVDYTFPLGTFFFDVEDVSTNTTDILSLTIQLPANTNIPVDAVVRKLDNTGVWRTLGNVTSTTISTAVIDRTLKTITLNLIDNDMFDTNPNVGLIRDPVALAIPKTTAVNNSGQTNPVITGGTITNNASPPGNLSSTSKSSGSLSLFFLMLFLFTATYRILARAKDKVSKHRPATSRTVFN